MRTYPGTGPSGIWNVYIQYNGRRSEHFNSINLSIYLSIYLSINSITSASTFLQSKVFNRNKVAQSPCVSVLGWKTASIVMSISGVIRGDYQTKVKTSLFLIKWSTTLKRCALRVLLSSNKSANLIVTLSRLVRTSPCDKCTFVLSPGPLPKNTPFLPPSLGRPPPYFLESLGRPPPPSGVTEFKITRTTLDYETPNMCWCFWEK